MTKEETKELQIGDYVCVVNGDLRELAMITRVSEDGEVQVCTQSCYFDDCADSISRIKLSDLSIVMLGLTDICAGKDIIFTESYSFFFRDKRTDDLHGAFIVDHLDELQHYLRIFGYNKEAQFHGNTIPLYL